MTTQRKTHPYYTFDKALSHNAVFNFLVGGRGIGKTYGAKKFVLRKALKTGEQFIYLRRYKTEMIAKHTFFADIEHEFPNYDFRVQGREAQAARTDTRDDKNRQWQTLGFFVSLSNSQTQKSVAFPKVKTIIFDEFIIEKTALRYLPDEVTVFINFYSTVDRYQDKTRVLFLANSVSIMNPYFTKFDIRPDEETEHVVKNDGFVYCHFIDSDEFNLSVYETKFGKFIQGTEYAEYAVGNKFVDNHKSLVEMKDPKARALFVLETSQGTFSVWHNLFTNQFYAQEKLPAGLPVYTLDPDSMSEEKTLMLKSDKTMQTLRTAFRRARMTFDSQKTRNSFIEVFK